MPRNPNKVRCQYPDCRAWAVRPRPGDPDSDSGPRLCASHAGLSKGAPPGNQNRLTHGFYASILPPEENAELTKSDPGTSLDGEIAITRIALRRLVRTLVAGTTLGPNPLPLDAGDYARFLGLTFQGVNTTSRLLRAKQDLGASGAGLYQELMDEVLDALSEEWGVDL